MRWGYIKWFDDEHIFISGGIGYQKPDPQAFKYVENAFALNPEETWYVGDTYEADVVGANTAGWHTIWFNHRNRECPKKKPGRYYNKEYRGIKRSY